ncbi:MBL fold metallo-hydrolase [Metabacillus bambusae]|uniref:MBL fold metallo-hydrolase n=1 Tax=Metabacillus bambusae TaxID=2795218 RepID=A0ABS3N2P7_9BACI|nr:MBL fold metallo-hydrolase [Metabacillus bambusae]MBO1512522.1 MBL fold metallo-hydrolase [Metabacillus bambusae]
MPKLYRNGEPLQKEVYLTQLPTNAVAFWNLGQSGILLKGKQDDGWICIDPYLTSSIEVTNPQSEFKRAFSPLLKPAMLKDIDGILVTHEHDDHLDLATLKELAQVSMETTFIVPAPSETLISRELSNAEIHLAKADQPFSVKGFNITPVPAAHTSYEIDEKNDHLYLGYFIEVNGIRIYHSGDTVITPLLIEKVKAFKPEIAFLPINGGDFFRTSRGIIGNMNFREAADFSVAVGVDLVIPIHFDMFPTNRENPAYFVDYLFHHYPAQKFHMMVPGERFVYHK